MTELSRTILAEYQVRKKKAQKTRFIELIRAHFPQAAVEEDNGTPLSRNIVVGSPEQARIIFTAHYDTCAVLPFPNLMTLSVPLYVLYMLAFAVIFAVLCFAVNFGMFRLLPLRWASFVAPLPCIGLLLLMLIGPANKHTANDNTSGVVTLCELMAGMDEETRAKCCFVFFDNEELGLLGSAFFRRRHRAAVQDKLLVNLDCVSDGDNIMLMLSKRARAAYAERLPALFGQSGDKTLLTGGSSLLVMSDHRKFPVHIGVAAFNRNPVFGLYAGRIHTSRDTVFDERNIEYLRQGLTRLAQSM
ncbi:MAG: M28 family peptidase [Clostridia bacterium]|nr:M28 family peptidase [Clostridia bacterium]